MANDFFDPRFRGGVNPADAFMKGRDIVERINTERLTSSLADMSPSEVLSSKQFKQLASANPVLAQSLASARLGAVKEQMAIDDNRLTAMFQDALTVKGLLGVSQDKAISFLSNRINTIGQMGGNPQDTLEIRNLIASGNVKQARSLLDDTIEAGRLAGVLPSPKKAAKQQGKGGLVFDPSTGTYTVDPIAKARFDELEKRKNAPEGLQIKDKRDINKDVTGFISEAIEIRKTAADLEKLSSVGGGPASIAAVFKFMKALDPRSVVREGEFATAENSAGVAETVRNMYNKYLKGERLSQSQFTDFVLTSKELANSAIQGAAGVVDDYMFTFGDSLPVKFTEKVKGRLPEMFRTPDRSNQQPTATPSKVLKFDAQGNPIG